MQKIDVLLSIKSANAFSTLSTIQAPKPVISIAIGNPRSDLALASVTDGNEKAPHDRRCLRYKIPYVESFEELTARELWETSEFLGINHVLDTIIGSKNEKENCDQHSDVRAVLTPVKSTFFKPTSPTLSGYEDSFDLLYKVANRPDHICDSNRKISGVIGSASIVTSPFAVIADNSETKKEKVNNFCLRVAYRGRDFCGWQTQHNNLEKPSVQRTLEEWLTELQNDQPLGTYKTAKPKRKRRTEKQEKQDTSAESNDSSSTKRNSKASRANRIKWADLPVAGRTDSGVSAIGQLCRYRTYRKDLTIEDIQKHLDDRARNTPPWFYRSLRVTQITPVSKAFHPTFTTSCRAYAYVIDTTSGGGGGADSNFLVEGRAEEVVELFDAMLRKIEGKPLDYIGLSYGRVKTQNTICTLYHARARLVEYRNRAPRATVTATDDGSQHQQQQQNSTRTAVCIELVGDRFLRRMVRLIVEACVRLVATADSSISKTNGSFDEDALLRLIQRQDRTLIGRPAPPDGLLFVGARV